MTRASDSPITGNKGEWSEVYTLLKIISQKHLQAGDEDLNKIEEIIFPIIKVLRTESNGSFEFSYQDNLVLINSDQGRFRIPVVKFYQQAKALLEAILQATGSSFSLPETSEFLASFKSVSLRASSAAKADIQVQVHDCRTGAAPNLGFSIKSQLGGPSTLLNAGQTTNFIFQITGKKPDINLFEHINASEGRQKLRDRLSMLQKHRYKLILARLQNANFMNNLLLIDSALPTILGDMLVAFYSGHGSKLTDLIHNLEQKNPLGFDLTSMHPFYAYKLKRLLTDIALGMMPNSVWTGTLDATGGFLVVKKDGEVLCYHIYNRNDFEDYLVKNTKFETASTSRYDFGSIYQEDGNWFIKLNLQIRFIK